METADKREVFLTIGIPTYGRPRPLARLLDSLDIVKYRDSVEILISENHSPLQKETRETVERFRATHDYHVSYYENEENEGFSGNIKRLSQRAQGRWLLIMGDDDLFVEDQLDRLFEFLEKHEELGFVLHTYRYLNPDGSWSLVSRYAEDTFFAAGEDAYVNTYRLSVPVSGIIFRNDWFREICDVDAMPANAYFHQVFAAEMCYNCPSACYSAPIVSYVPFEQTNAEKEIWKSSGDIRVEDVGSYTKVIKDSFFVSQYMDEKYGIDSTAKIKADYSKYSLPLLTHFPYGSPQYKAFEKELRNMGLDCTKYYKIYKMGLALFGEKGCYKLVDLIKRFRGGTTPTL